MDKLILDFISNQLKMEFLSSLTNQELIRL